MIELIQTKRTDLNLLNRMNTHYSQPKGFVGRNICYAIIVNTVYYGHIVGGSATRFLPGRNEFLGISLLDLDHVINNIFFNASPPEGEKYPLRNFTSAILGYFIQQATQDWKTKYGDTVIGFESLVELPRTGELYRRAGWTPVGITKGYTCKRISGQGSDGWSGKRSWDTINLRPKTVWCYKL